MKDHRVIDMALSLGFGVEDIAVQLGLSEQAVRDRIEELRAAGKIREICLGEQSDKR
jgi:biotin operon repressor